MVEQKPFDIQCTNCFVFYAQISHLKTHRYDSFFLSNMCAFKGILWIMPTDQQLINIITVNVSYYWLAGFVFSLYFYNTRYSLVLLTATADQLAWAKVCFSRFKCNIRMWSRVLLFVSILPFICLLLSLSALLALALFLSLSFFCAFASFCRHSLYFFFYIRWLQLWMLCIHQQKKKCAKKCVIQQSTAKTKIEKKNVML